MVSLTPQTYIPLVPSPAYDWAPWALLIIILLDRVVKPKENVVVINAEKVTLSGNKWENKEYIRHTGYPGGQRSINASALLKKFPERLVEKAVKGMLPKNRLGKKLFGNLYVFVGENHDKEAQKPKKVELN